MNEFLRFGMDKKLLIEFEWMKFFENIFVENYDGLKIDNIFWIKIIIWLWKLKFLYCLLVCMYMYIYMYLN